MFLIIVFYLAAVYTCSLGPEKAGRVVFSATQRNNYLYLNDDFSRIARSRPFYLVSYNEWIRFIKSFSINNRKLIRNSKFSTSKTEIGPSLKLQVVNIKQSTSHKALSSQNQKWEIIFIKFNKIISKLAQTWLVQNTKHYRIHITIFTIFKISPIYNFFTEKTYALYIFTLYTLKTLISNFTRNWTKNTFTTKSTDFIRNLTFHLKETSLFSNITYTISLTKLTPMMDIIELVQKSINKFKFDAIIKPIQFNLFIETTNKIINSSICKLHKTITTTSIYHNSIQKWNRIIFYLLIIISLRYIKTQIKIITSKLPLLKESKTTLLNKSSDFTRNLINQILETSQLSIFINITIFLTFKTLATVKTLIQNAIRDVYEQLIIISSYMSNTHFYISPLRNTSSNIIINKHLATPQMMPLTPFVKGKIRSKELVQNLINLLISLHNRYIIRKKASFHTSESSSKSTKGYKYKTRIKLLGGARNINEQTNENLPDNDETETIKRRTPLLRTTNRIDAERIGCINNSNSCYMNVLIQTLNSISTFREMIINYKGRENNIIVTLKDIFKALNTKQSKHFTWYIDLRDTQIYNILKFNPSTQSDTHEVFVRLMNEIENIDESITEQFKFKETKEIPERDLINTMKINTLLLNTPINDTEEESIYSIESMLDDQLDVIEEGNIEENIPASRTTHEINQNILCIRFDRNTREGMKKMYKLVLKKNIEVQDTEYTLKSTIVHRGADLQHGHYIAYIFEENKTILINDIESQTVNTKYYDDYVICDEINGDGRTYMAFYEKTSVLMENRKSSQDYIVHARKGPMPNLRPMRSLKMT